MPKNNGKTSEEIFEAYWDARGKRSYYHRLMDTADVMGRVRRALGKAVPIAGLLPEQPSDYFVVDAEHGTMFAEVKSSQAKVSFPFSNIKRCQTRAAKRALAAGGQYFFFIHALAHECWFKVPAQVILECEGASLKWSQLEKYRWTVSPK